MSERRVRSALGAAVGRLGDPHDVEIYVAGPLADTKNVQVVQSAGVAADAVLVVASAHDGRGMIVELGAALARVRNGDREGVASRCGMPECVNAHCPDPRPRSSCHRDGMACSRGRSWNLAGRAVPPRGATDLPRALRRSTACTSRLPRRGCPLHGHQRSGSGGTWVSLSRTTSKCLPPSAPTQCVRTSNWRVDQSSSQASTPAQVRWKRPT